MKLTRIISLFIILILALTLMVSCRLAPTEEKWYLSSYKKNMTFIGGLESEIGFAQASVVYPFANADFSSVSISFNDDGTFNFITYDGEKVNGTFTYEHEGNYTNVYFESDNGESFSGSSMKMITGEKYLMFEYSGISYTFSPIKREDGPTLDEIVEQVRSGKAEELHNATVTKQEDMYVAKFSEVISYNIASDTLVYAIEIHADGSYTILDHIKEGEALSTYNESGNYVVLYYLNEK